MWPLCESANQKVSPERMPFATADHKERGRVSKFRPSEVSSYTLYLCNMSQSRVFIGRLSLQARERDVESFLRGYGRIRDVSLKRGYGFVVGTVVDSAAIFDNLVVGVPFSADVLVVISQEFDDYRDAEDAIYDLNGTTLLGERYAVFFIQSISSRHAVVRAFHHIPSVQFHPSYT